MGSIISRNSRHKKIMTYEQAVMRKIWNGLENNLQYHANRFFLDFCAAYPQYTKYFTFDPDIPLTIDVQTSTKFVNIMDAMSYLLIYFYHKPNELKYLIGYIAMVHKDMELTKDDMTNFAESFTNYLARTFPQLITSESEAIVSKCIKYITDEISINIELFRNDAINDNQSNYSCMNWLCDREIFIYGHVIDHWIKRKHTWEERLRDWKLRSRMTIVPSKDSSRDESGDNNSDDKDNEDSTINIVQVLEPYTTSKDDNLELLLPRKRVVLRVKKPGQSKYEIVESIDITDDKKLTNEKSQASSINELTEDEKESSFKNNRQSSTSLLISASTLSPAGIDSPARIRRRQRLHNSI